LPAQQRSSWICASREWARGERIMRWIRTKLNPFILQQEVRADFLRGHQAELRIARRLDGGNRRSFEIRSNLNIYKAPELT
jgi:hypothetical protein